jgi:hypothetical protein
MSALGITERSTVQFLRKNETHMLVFTEDIYITWIDKQPYGVKFTYRGRFFKLAFQWGTNA